MVCVVTISTVDALVGKLTICTPKAVHAGGVFYHQKAIITIFIAIRGGDHVAVFVAVGEVAIVGIFGFVID